MSIVTPIPEQTIIKTYKGVNWDNTYQNIRLFDNVNQQVAYFNDKITNTWNSCSVVKTRQAVRVEGNINDYVTDNYMSFENKGFRVPKIYYCFIIAVNYVNVNTIEIEYEIDWVQSFIFEFSLEACFVEREHVNDDTFGKNTLPEGLDTGEYVIKEVQSETFEPAWKAEFLSSVAEPQDMIVKDNIIIATQIAAGSLESISLNALKDIVNQLNKYGEPERLVSLQMIARGMQQTNGIHQSFNVGVDDLAFTDATGSYNAVNQKMRCFPYKLLTVDNFSGGVEQYHYELFRDGNPSFAIEGTMNPKPVMECVPIQYNHWSGTDSEKNTVSQMGVMYTDFPLIPWISDTYRAWVSQNQWSIASDMVSSFVGVAVSGAEAGIGIGTGNLGLAAIGAGGLASNASSALSQVENYRNHKIHGQQLHGGTAASGLNYFRGDIGFRVTEYSIRPEMARKIDKFFTRYGYRVDTVKVPNIRGRQYFNYVKCRNAQIQGNIPNDTKRILEAALNNGTTFWHINNIGGDASSNPIV